jgi:Astacin (Peptidase family M12A)
MSDDDQPATNQVADDNTGFLSSTDIRTGFISGNTFENKPVQYAAVNGRAFFEGDICLGTVEQMEQQAALVAAGADGEVAHGVVIPGAQYRWPNAVMPYEIDGGLPNQQRVTDAIAHWQANTTMRFVLRTAANAAQYPNYVRVFKGDGCWSYVGMQGGRQDLSLADGCSTGAAIHEFGHAFGLWHEQSREDRGTYVQVHWENIEAGKESNFNQHISDGDDVGGYDYASIMHYGRFAFSKNNQPTLTQLKAGPTIGQRSGLSAGDIAAVHAIYRTLHTNLTITQVYATPGSRNAWAYFSGLGWRRIDPASTDGVTDVFVVLASARATGRTVHAFLDGQYVYHAYGN